MRRGSLKASKTYYCLLQGVDPTQKSEDTIVRKPRKGKLRMREDSKAPTSTLLTLLGDNSEKMIICPNIKLIDGEGAEYPDRTDTHCCWDRYPFDHPPSGIPIKLEIIGDTYYFHCLMISCSTECSNSFYDANKHNPIYASTKHLLGLLHNLLQIAKGKEKSPPGYAPHWNLLKTVGQGTMDIIDFRKNTGTRYFALPQVKLLQAATYHQKCNAQ